MVSEKPVKVGELSVSKDTSGLFTILLATFLVI